MSLYNSVEKGLYHFNIISLLSAVTIVGGILHYDPKVTTLHGYYKCICILKKIYMRLINTYSTSLVVQAIYC